MVTHTAGISSLTGLPTGEHPTNIFFDFVRPVLKAQLTVEMRQATSDNVDARNG